MENNKTQGNKRTSNKLQVVSEIPVAGILTEGKIIHDKHNAPNSSMRPAFREMQIEKLQIQRTKILVYTRLERR